MNKNKEDAKAVVVFRITESREIVFIYFSDTYLHMIYKIGMYLYKYYIHDIKIHSYLLIRKCLRLDAYLAPPMAKRRNRRPKTSGGTRYLQRSYALYYWHLQL